MQVAFADQLELFADQDVSGQCGVIDIHCQPGFLRAKQRICVVNIDFRRQQR